MVIDETHLELSLPYAHTLTGRNTALPGDLLLNPLLWFLAIVGLIIAWVLGRPILRERRRERLRCTPFPAASERLLQGQVPIYRRLPVPLKQQLQEHIQVFLAEKEFYGCAGLEVTEAMRVLIAAQACLLILNRKTDYYGKLRSILVYPSAFIVRQEHRDEAGVVTIAPHVHTGESWEVGRVILAWDEVEEGLRGRSGSNVVLHEFAHQLDEEDRAADGVPLLADPAHYQTWARVFSKEYQALREIAPRGEPTVLDPYGAEAPAEFFAVATEAFFQTPEQLKHHHPELYEQLREYYRVDPAAWG